MRCCSSGRAEGPRYSSLGRSSHAGFAACERSPRYRTDRLISRSSFPIPDSLLSSAAGRHAVAHLDSSGGPKARRDSSLGRSSYAGFAACERSPRNRPQEHTSPEGARQKEQVVCVVLANPVCMVSPHGLPTRLPGSRNLLTLTRSPREYRATSRGQEARGNGLPVRAEIRLRR